MREEREKFMTPGTSALCDSRMVIAGLKHLPEQRHWPRKLSLSPFQTHTASGGDILIPITARLCGTPILGTDDEVAGKKGEDPHTSPRFSAHPSENFCFPYNLRDMKPFFSVPKESPGSWMRLQPQSWFQSPWLFSRPLEGTLGHATSSPAQR